MITSPSFLFFLYKRQLPISMQAALVNQIIPDKKRASLNISGENS